MKREAYILSIINQSKIINNQRKSILLNWGRTPQELKLLLQAFQDLSNGLIYNPYTHSQREKCMREGNS